MSMPDEFFRPENIDEQIKQLSQQQLAGNKDAELIAYLQSSFATDAAQERETLDRMWARVSQAAPEVQPQSSWKGTITSMHEQQTMRSNAPGPKRRSSRWQRLGILAAVLFLVILVGSAAIVFNTFYRPSTGPAGNGGIQSGTPTTAPTTAATSAATFKVTSIDMAVSPSSLAGRQCGTSLTVNYTATFHVAPNSNGGKVQFTYTVNNGRSQTPASLTFAAGETTKSYTFSWSGVLPADHTYPGPGGVQVTSPNNLTSQLVAPSGSCSQQQQSAFQVLSVTMSVSPASLAGRNCGTALTVTYTATFHIAANSPGGTIHFYYTTNNGRGSTPASVTVGAGVTTKTYSFTWSGTLPADHTAPGEGGVMVSSPNSITSAMVEPTGKCN